MQMRASTKIKDGIMFSVGKLKVREKTFDNIKNNIISESWM